MCAQNRLSFFKKKINKIVSYAISILKYLNVYFALVATSPQFINTLLKPGYLSANMYKKVTTHLKESPVVS